MHTAGRNILSLACKIMFYKNAGIFFLVCRIMQKILAYHDALGLDVANSAHCPMSVAPLSILL